MHIEARMKARFDRSTTPMTTRPTTTLPHPREVPPTMILACPSSLGVCDDAPKVDLSHREFGQEFSYDIQAFSTYEPTAQSMCLLDRYYFLSLMDPPPYFYAASLREFFSTLEDWRGGIESSIFLSEDELILFPLRPLLQPLVYHYLLLLKPDLHLSHNQLFYGLHVY